MHKVRRIVTSRRGGVSRPPYEEFNLGSRVGDDPAAVTANRERLARELALEPDRIAWMHQVHGIGVTILDESGTPQPADAVPDDAVPDDAVPDDAVPDDAVPDDAVPRDVVPGAPGGPATGDDVSATAAVSGDPAAGGAEGGPDGGDPDGPMPHTDALVTRTPGLALAVLVADCVPVLLADRRAGVVAAVHAGRPGAAAGIVPRALAAMCSLGARPQDIDVLLGPAICGACYEVPPAMQADVERRLPGSATRTRAGTTGLDLRAGIAAQLLAGGVTGVVHDPRCTAEDPDLYSYRRDGVTGRQAGLVWLA